MTGTKYEEYVDGVPGSLLLTDDANKHVDALHASGERDVILNPQPSLDCNDPLNWTQLRKHINCFCTLWYTFAIAFTCSAFYAGFGEIEETRGISLSTLTQGTGYLYGFFGWGGCFVIPLALRYGHKPIYIASLFICMGMTIWTPYITTSGQWIASRIIFGFFGTPVENLNEQTIAMIFFSHERGFYLGLYAFVLYGGAFLSPVITGFIFAGTGLEGVCWTAGALCGGSAIFMWLFFEEVNFNRRAAMEVDTQQAGKTIDPEHKVDPTVEKPVGEKTGDDTAVLNNNNTTSSVSGSEEGANTTVHSRRILRGTPHSFVYKLGMFRETYCTLAQTFTAVWRPVWLCFRFPAIFYAGFSYGCSLSIYTIFTGTISVVLGGEPYNFGSTGQGLVYLSPLLAAFISGPAIGYVGDRLSLKWARKNNGVREPEHRLILSVFLVVIPWAFVQWGVGAVHQIQWFGLVVALFLIGVYSVVQAALSITYALDSYRDLSGEVLVAVVLVRNTLTFGIGYSVVPLITNLGIQNAYLTLGFSAVGFILLFVPMLYFGKFFRRESKDLYWRYVEDSAFSH